MKKGIRIEETLTGDPFSALAKYKALIVEGSEGTTIVKLDNDGRLLVQQPSGDFVHQPYLFSPKCTYYIPEAPFELTINDVMSAFSKDRTKQFEYQVNGKTYPIIMNNRGTVCVGEPTNVCTLHGFFWTLKFREVI